MQSNKNNSTQINTNESKTEVDAMLLQNKELFLDLVSENTTRREKSFMVITEYDIIHQFENNLVNLIKRCPPDQVGEILSEINKMNIE